MKCILFVDDEQDLLDGLRNALRRKRTVWEMRFAVGGEAALREMEARPVDVVVSDMRMPGMDGLALLGVVRKQYPRAARIILSGHADLASVVRASAVAHQYVLKPCDQGVMCAVIERALRIQELLASEPLRQIVGELGTLPARPAMYEALTSALADPGVEVRKLAAIVEKDVALAARVLQFVNSAYCGLLQRVSGIDAAIALLGLNTLRHIALTTEVFRSFSGKDAEDVEALAHHAILTARIARRLVGGARDVEAAFTAGLLHDCGKLVLASRLPEAYRHVREVSRREDLAALTAEQETFGATHAEVGAYLLGLWDLPHDVVDPVAHHHSPDRLGVLDTVGVVVLADALANEAETKEREGHLNEIVQAFSSVGDVRAWRELARAEALASAFP